MIRKEPPHSEDLLYRASSSSNSPHVGDNGGTKRLKGTDYEVFLSFRGEDTRKGFTDHLYTSLVDAGIHVYRDNDELRVGDEIGPELLRSIMQSKISIPIISEDYASSKWCLQELAQMLKCRRSGEQVVLPIFYKVEPSQVRHLKGRFGDAVNAHNKKLDQMIVKEWEDALKEVSFLKGWESEKIDDGHEAVLVKRIVRRVMSELKRLFHLSVPKQLVGIDDRVEQIMSEIDVNFNGTWIIGIYGMGGIGKTTLAKVLYNKLSSHFENRSFVANIRETAQHKGIECLQKQLISGIIGTSWDMSNVDDGIHVLKSRCTSKKVLTLLDDIDDNTHLDALIEDGISFKAGSILIITTRNKSILKKVGVCHLYELEKLPLDKSLILFSRHAFRNDFPPSGYEDISYDIVSITGGLPLALEVIGSFLCGKTKDAWKDTSKKLKKIPDEKVQKRLRISYEALEYEDQQIFLDIACFFIGSSKQNPTYMWDACGFYPGKGIEVLSLMSLIKIGEDGELMMHDQLRDLGREIVRLENKSQPRERSRLWIEEEAKHVLESNKMATELKVLDLSNCDNLRRTPDLSAFESLEILNLERCDNLKEIHPSICYIKTLVHLNVRQCFELKKLPTRVGRMEESRELLCYDKPAQLPESIGSFESLTELYLSGTSIKELPEFIDFMEALETLDIVGCESLDHIPNSIGNLASLSVLYIINSSLREIPDSIGKLQSLVELDLSVTEITKLPESIGNLQNLRELNIEATAVTELPESIGNLQNLRELNITSTPVTELPSAIGKLAKLYRLKASYCIYLEGLPSSIGELVSLNELDLEWSGIRSLPEGISKLSSLRLLDVSGCKNLQKVPEPFFSLTALERPQLIRNCAYHRIRVRKGTKWVTTSSGTPAVATSSEEGDSFLDEATSSGTPAVATSSEEGDPLSLSLSWPYKFRPPNTTIAKSSEEGDPPSLSLSL